MRFSQRELFPQTRLNLQRASAAVLNGIWANGALPVLSIVTLLLLMVALTLPGVSRAQASLAKAKAIMEVQATTHTRVVRCPADYAAAVPSRGCTTDGKYNLYLLQGDDDDLKWTIQKGGRDLRVDGQYFLRHMAVVNEADAHHFKCTEFFCRTKEGDIVGLHPGWAEQKAKLLARTKTKSKT